MASQPSAQSHHPILTASEIGSSLKRYGHHFNPDVKLFKANLSDMVGMSGFGVAFVRLLPHADSTTIHYHLVNSEWAYILSGQGTLLLLDASIPYSHTRSALSSSLTDQPPPFSPAQIEERQLGPGDFVGYQGGLGASRYAHGIKAGEGGMDILMGGTRERVDTCIYPTVGRTIVYDDTDPGLTMSADVPASRDPKAESQLEGQ